jgi:hypothetical protein
MRVVSAGQNCIAHHLLAIESEGDKNVKIRNSQPAVSPACRCKTQKATIWLEEPGTNREATSTKELFN